MDIVRFSFSEGLRIFTRRTGDREETGFFRNCLPVRDVMRYFSRGSQRSQACPWYHALFLGGWHSSLAASGGGRRGKEGGVLPSTVVIQKESNGGSGNYFWGCWFFFWLVSIFWSIVDNWHIFPIDVWRPKNWNSPQFLNNNHVCIAKYNYYSILLPLHLSIYFVWCSRTTTLFSLLIEKCAHTYIFIRKMCLQIYFEVLFGVQKSKFTLNHV